ncbi:hypothetical protein [Streptomyces sp. 5-10]|uniref:hypothetical protein n=1 Tax=Streptomyces sp. 5-10 TaxID=878925 RepID=UPI00168B0A64|nr:hypothetical protein [Streptomyces sp. 5-10]MBD3004707.1 hypothetical protein [Streptomyces sp. 5-10]
MNPMLQEGFLFCSSNFQMLVPHLVSAAGLPDVQRDFSYGEGGPGGYQIGMAVRSYGRKPERYRDMDVFVFSRISLMASTAEKFLAWAGLGEMDRIVFTAPDFGEEFMTDLVSRRKVPVHFLTAHDDDPWFRPVAPGSDK